MTTIALNCWSRPPLRSNDRRAWQSQHRAKAEAREQAAWVIRAARPAPITGPVHATLTYRPKTHQVQDCGSISPTLKIVLDAAVDVGLLQADDYRLVASETCVIVPPDGDPGMWLELVEVAP